MLAGLTRDLGIVNMVVFALAHICRCADLQVVHVAIRYNPFHCVPHKCHNMSKSSDAITITGHDSGISHLRLIC